MQFWCFWRGHASPPPFNPFYRPGLREAVGHGYRAYSDAHPEATPAELQAVYARLNQGLGLVFPVWTESPLPH